ncbi:MAG: DUF4079 domain-containing protein [Symploca sp. SIO2B6]|nr:DUF4079 domain-containing protein [Symploca sp. SIO2B6]
MGFKEFASLLHPTFAVIIVFPLIGIVVNFAWQTRQRRLQTANKGKSKIPPIVGPDHLKLGRWLTTSVFTATLLGLGFALGSKIIPKQEWVDEPFRVTFIVLMFLLTILSYIFLYRAKKALWRGTFATLAGMGLVILGSQPEVFRRDYEWYLSHYYFGMAATLLMLFSMAIVKDIYKDKKHRWRIAHTVLNVIATLLFALQGFTGSRDLFEIGLYTAPPGLILPFPW